MGERILENMVLFNNKLYSCKWNDIIIIQDEEKHIMKNTNKLSSFKIKIDKCKHYRSETSEEARMLVYHYFSFNSGFKEPIRKCGCTYYIQRFAAILWNDEEITDHHGIVIYQPIELELYFDERFKLEILKDSLNNLKFIEESSGLSFKKDLAEVLDTIEKVNDTLSKLSGQFEEIDYKFYQPDLGYVDINKLFTNINDIKHWDLYVKNYQCLYEFLNFDGNL